MYTLESQLRLKGICYLINSTNLHDVCLHQWRHKDKWGHTNQWTSKCAISNRHFVGMEVFAHVLQSIAYRIAKMLQLQ